MTAHPREQDMDGQLRDFLRASRFGTAGAVMTDLDGTAVHEDRGRIFIPQPVEFGLRELHSTGRPFILNSLRFPLSVLRTFGREWYSISNSPIPLVSLNGSLVGRVVQNNDNELEFEEIGAAPITAQEIAEVLRGVRGLLDNGIKDVLVFYYPRDWRMGEIIWTPVAENVLHIKQKYVSASSVLPSVRSTRPSLMITSGLSGSKLIARRVRNSLHAPFRARSASEASRRRNVLFLDSSASRSTIGSA